MIVFDKVNALHQQLKNYRRAGLTVALVPTMGNLHAGHFTLVKEAQKQADIVVVSIFVNPMQFNNASDLEKYPRTLAADIEGLEQEQVTLLFAPTLDEIYPSQLALQTLVSVPYLSTVLEGASRPGHFDGVSTIVAKLFNIVQPDLAFFGEKDFQQLALIQKMVLDLAYHIKIVSVPTVRESSGLALSSRNSRLSKIEKTLAPLLSEVMYEMADKLLEYKICDLANENNIILQQLILNGHAKLEQAGFRVDEIFICDPVTLKPLTTNSTHAVILMAAYLGDIRLIDNKIVAY